mmetsp:Transcript_4159/g.5230  ORF Transcript_4159/g.5230 Transcript_4159/m.5230 type:complete len:91 (-) Transcript_4159:213-485(-)
MQESSEVGLAADHDTSPTDESVAAPPDGRARGASGTRHRLRTPCPDYLYKPWTDESEAAPPHGWVGSASGSWRRLRTPSPDYLYKPRCAA